MVARFDFFMFERIFDPHLRSLQESSLVPRQDIECWREHLEAAERSGTFFLAMTFFVVAGTKSDGT